MLYCFYFHIVFWMLIQALLSRGPLQEADFKSIFNVVTEKSPGSHPFLHVFLSLNNRFICTYSSDIQAIELVFTHIAPERLFLSLKSFFNVLVEKVQTFTGCVKKYCFHPVLSAVNFGICSI
ncbi:hypothetical protein DM860_008994 [Cuscuta australis]|uniref:Longin domain-containing protein n=1 Tax=Cuscuta australis TaxID=267555 RepID=A0A328D7K7_9ASTE|nr:hypothetical protein DM860_008994 [Cuscuta australis]